MDFVSVIVLFFIVVPSVATGVFLNWQQLKNGRQWLKHKWWRFKWYGIPRVRRYVKNIWTWNKQCIKSLGNWCKFLWKNPAILLLVIAGLLIFGALIFFGSDIYKLYVNLSGQIKKLGNTDEIYRGIAIRYFGIIAGAGAVIGYIIAISRNITANNQNKISERVQITESMGQAIAQIGAFNDGKPNIEIRLGGLYSLQRIMQDSPRDELSIAEIFYAYVRRNAKRDKLEKATEDKEGEQKIEQPREDIQTALDIINRFNKEWREQDKEIPTDVRLNFSRANFSGYSFTKMDFSHAILEDVDLSNAKLMHTKFSNARLISADLSGADLFGADLCKAVLFRTDLSDADLTCADLSGANLSYTILSDADLSSANLFGADLRGKNLTTVCLQHANLTGANLSGADLSGVDLREADLTEADLSGANLSGTNLSETNLSGADLSKAVNVSSIELDSAKGDESTYLPDGILHPDHWMEGYEEPDWDEYRKRDE